MTDPGNPESGPDALDEAYRRASGADSSRPSDQTRAAILANARAVAAAAREQAKPAIATERPAANDPFWWRSAAASVAIAVVGLMIWAPHFESNSVQGSSAPRQEPVASALETPPPAAEVAAAAQDRALATNEARPEEFPASRARLEAPTRLAEPAPKPRQATGSLRAASPPPPPIPAEPTRSASASVSAPANADAAAAGDVAAAVPDADQRPHGPSAAPPAAARKAEINEIVVTGGRARAAAESRNATVAPPAAAARDSLSDDAVAALARDLGDLNAAIARGDATRVLALVAPKGALEARDARGRTPLMRAVEAGQARVVRVLLEAGADPNAPDTEGATPHARAANRADIAALLEEHGGH